MNSLSPAPAGPDAIAPGLRHHSMGAANLDDPELQLGSGCLIDQLVGQYMAEVTGLGPLGPVDQTLATLASVRRFNHHESLAGHFNHMRSYALGDEAATLMCSYPRGNRPERGDKYIATSWILFQRAEQIFGG